MVSSASPALAVLGAPPRFAEKLHVGRPNIGDKARLFQRFEEILERRWLSNLGAAVQEFEARLKEITGARHCIPLCNATVGLEIAARALGLSGEVIVPSFTFVATAHALRWLGLTPVFCDVDPHSHNLDPQAVERLITPRTSGILGVHLWGRGCAVMELERLAMAHGLKLFFDAAHGLGCSAEGRPIGGWGSAEVFSFHATKFINTGEGGAIATNDDALAERIRLMKNFGFAGQDRVVSLGINGKMNEFSAAIGLTNLESMDEFIAANRSRLKRYERGLAGCRGLEPIAYVPEERNNYQYVVYEVRKSECPLRRDELLRVLQAENVLARRYFFPGCHRAEPYQRNECDADRRLPVTERLCDEVLVFPTGTGISEEDVDAICEIVRAALDRPDEIRSRLAAVEP